MLTRFLLYGALGWCIEVVFTGAVSALRRDRSATARTYLWMHPIYGAAGLALERAQDVLAPAPRVVRGIGYLSLIYAAEYSSGWLLRRLLGRCPWDYAQRGLSVHGLIRLDYAPAWFVAGMVAEPARKAVAEIVPALQRVVEAPGPRQG